MSPFRVIAAVAQLESNLGEWNRQIALMAAPAPAVTAAGTAALPPVADPAPSSTASALSTASVAVNTVPFAAAADSLSPASSVSEVDAD